MNQKSCLLTRNLYLCQQINNLGFPYGQVRKIFQRQKPNRIAIDRAGNLRQKEFQKLTSNMLDRLMN